MGNHLDCCSKRFEDQEDDNDAQIRRSCSSIMPKSRQSYKSPHDYQELAPKHLRNKKSVCQQYTNLLNQDLLETPQKSPGTEYEARKEEENLSAEDPKNLTLEDRFQKCLQKSIAKSRKSNVPKRRKNAKAKRMFSILEKYRNKSTNQNILSDLKFSDEEESQEENPFKAHNTSIEHSLFSNLDVSCIIEKGKDVLNDSDIDIPQQIERTISKSLSKDCSSYANYPVNEQIGDDSQDNMIFSLAQEAEIERINSTELQKPDFETVEDGCRPDNTPTRNLG
ncbi:unnamed protein product [Moneuplotes crassus]|uniref:Uncharacterized protein n=1 Tax=Euplotes crassus TaxID=5936 RepID=A0AAD1ULQ5_EUPCR|nr:unnamed protein product [Moneuplotes crassus]